MDITELKHLQNIAAQIRRDIICMTTSAASGHPGGSLGCTEYMTALYFEILKHDPQNFTMNGKNQDMFFLSNGHISPVWYSVLARSGYFPVSELATFRKLGSRLQGHPSITHKLPGIRVASGSLGQGLSVAIGAALAKKMDNDNHLIFSLHGDGELQEGQIWEAAMFAAAHKVDNLISTIDCNNQQIDGTVEHVLPLGDLFEKWTAFGWEVLTIKNGNSMEDVVVGLEAAKALTGKGKPIAVLMHTEMGYGVDFMQGTNKYHGLPPTKEECECALKQLSPTTLGDY